MANSQKQGNYEVGYKKPPKNRQFGQPEGNKSSRGAWKKEDTPRYKLEQMMKLDEDELLNFISGRENYCPYYRFYDEYKSVAKQN